MYRLTGSVGQGGRNAHDDVLLVQVQLNKNAHLVEAIGRVPEDGNLDDATQRAIIAFQRDVGRLSAPDGRVDPHGATWRRLVGDVPHAAVEAFSALTPVDGSFYLYENQDRVWGTTLTLQSIRTLVATLRPAGIVLGIGDISYAQGGRMPPHASHRRGIDVDIRPQREDQARSPVRISDPAYSHDRTKLVVDAVTADDNLELIFFNDRKMPGVRFHEGHDNHLHCRFKA
jgi:penicillin-insensitive murein endopeptidase/putative peptidoglycan binding protein